MKIAIINDIHVGKALIYSGMVRAASHLIEEVLEEVLHKILKLHSPNLIVNLGDLIRSENKDQDLKSYSKQLSRLKHLSSPLIHVLGNHELKKMNLTDVENAWNAHGFNQKAYGSREVEDFRIIWLGLELENASIPHKAILPQQQINWLNEELKRTNKRTIIFSHYPLDDHNTTGNFFYEAMDNKSTQALFLYNQKQVRKIIQSVDNVVAVFQAHLHYFHININKDLPYITCPAMGDNICTPQLSNNIPEVYTIVDLSGKKLIVKAYSREYCFAGYEQYYNNAVAIEN